MSGKQRNLRKRRATEEDPEDGDAANEPEVHSTTLEDLKLLQKQRKRITGVDAAALATRGGEGANGNPEDNELMEAYVKAQGGQNILDEQTHMQKYVEQELARRLGKSVEEEQVQ